MSAAAVAGMRFAYSPLTEVAKSLHMVASGRITVVHRGWYACVRHDLSRLDTSVLTAVVPPRPRIAGFLFAGATDTRTTIEDQLRGVAAASPTELLADLAAVWENTTLPTPVRTLLVDSDGPRRLASLLWDYWSAAIEPHWSSIRAVLDEDVVYRATQLIRHGVGEMLAGLHESMSVVSEVLDIDAPVSSRGDLAGVGLVLVPSAFVWPRAVLAPTDRRPGSLIYPARGVGGLWSQSDPRRRSGDPLAALLGRSRAAILGCLAVPISTTELAVKLGQSPPSVNQHLTLLRRSGLATCWRSGRRVLYCRTAVADSIVAAASDGQHPAR